MGVEYTAPDARDTWDIIRQGGLILVPGVIVGLLLGAVFASIIESTGMGDPSKLGLFYWVPMTILGILLFAAVES